MAEAVGRGVLRERRRAGRRLSQRLSARAGCARRRARSSTACRKWRIGPEPFVSRVRAGLAGRTAELERLAVEMFARGLSTRDIEAAFQRRDRGQPAEPHGREPGDRAAVAGVRGLRRPGPERVRGRLLLRRRRGRAAARRDAARGGALCLGDHRGRPEGAAAPGARARRRTRRAARRSSRTSSAAAWPTRCWSSPTGRPG